MVLGAGLEPARISPHAPQACVSANFTTRAGGKRRIVYHFCPHDAIGVRKISKKKIVKANGAREKTTTTSRQRSFALITKRIRRRQRVLLVARPRHPFAKPRLEAEGFAPSSSRGKQRQKRKAFKWRMIYSPNNCPKRGKTGTRWKSFGSQTSCDFQPPNREFPLHGALGNYWASESRNRQGKLAEGFTQRGNKTGDTRQGGLRELQSIPRVSSLLSRGETTLEPT